MTSETRSTTSSPGVTSAGPRRGRSGAASTWSEMSAAGSPSTVRGTLARPDAAGFSIALGLVAVAWTTLLALDATGVAASLHHHALIEAPAPLWATAPLFLVAWS